MAQYAAAFKIIVLVVLLNVWKSDCATNPAELIPIVAPAATDSSSNIDTLNPSNWTPNTPQPSPTAALNLTVAQPDSERCPEANTTRVLVHDLGKSFCVQGWPLCNTDNHKGVCPHAQRGLPNGSHCSLLPNSKKDYGCVEKVAPTSCHPRSFKT